MGKKLVFYLAMCFILAVAFFHFVSAESVSDSLHLNIQTTNVSTGEIITGTFNFAFNITTNSDCSGVVYSNSTTLTTNSRGIVSYYLEDVSLDFDQQYYLCYYRDGSLINSTKMARSPYAFRAKNITISGLVIDQNLDMSGYNVTADYFIGDGSLLTNINASSVNYWSQSGSNLYYNSGNVGIGLSNPTRNLIVNGSTTDNPLLELVSVTNDAYMRFGRGAGSYYWDIGQFAEASSDFEIRNHSGDSIIHLDYTGNVGIGTTSPGNALHIYSDEGVTSQPLFIEGGQSDGDKTEIIYGGEDSSSQSAIIGYYASTADDNDYGYLQINNKPVVYTWTGTGKAGIGTTSPQNKLNVVGDINATANISTAKFCLDGDCITEWGAAVGAEGGWNDTGDVVELVNSADNVSAGTFYVDNSNSRVGVGTSTPGVDLDVDGTVGATSVLATSNVQAGDYMRTPYLTPYTSGGNVDFRNYAGDTSYLSVNTTTGYVGVGTESPSELLSINVPTSTQKGIQFVDDGSLLYGAKIVYNESQNFLQISGYNNGALTGGIYVPRNSGYVGIGTDSPEGPLHISYSSQPRVAIFTSVSGDSVWSGGEDNDLIIKSLANSATEGIKFQNEDGTDQMFIRKDGNIGINTLLPSEKLHVNGSILANGTINATTDVCIEGGECLSTISASGLGAVTGSGTSGYLSRWNGTTSLNNSPVYTDGVNVGIGTTSPYEKLNVMRTGAGDIARFADDSSTKGLIIAIDASGNPILKGTSSNQPMTISPDGYLAFETDGIERMRILQSSGNVGIGTTSPSSKLQIGTELTGDGSESNYITIGKGWNAASGIKWSRQGTSDTLVYSDASENLVFETDATNVGAIGNFIFKNDGAEKVRISADGKVGIGTTDPQNTLNVVGDINATANISTAKFCLSGDCISEWGAAVGAEGGWNDTGDVVELVNSADNVSAGVLFVDNTNSKVGIGTTTPSRALDVYTTAAQFTRDENNDNPFAFMVRKIRGSSAVQSGDRIGNFQFEGYDGDSYVASATIAAIVEGSVSNNNVPLGLKFATGSSHGGATEVMRISSDGKVGIGTTTPSQKLSVDGNILQSNGNFLQTTGNYLSTDQVRAIDEDGLKLTDDGSNGIFVQDGGDVGIGTTEPQAKLDVQNGGVNIYLG